MDNPQNGVSNIKNDSVLLEIFYNDSKQLLEFHI